MDLQVKGEDDILNQYISVIISALVCGIGRSWRWTWAIEILLAVVCLVVLLIYMHIRSWSLRLLPVGIRCTLRCRSPANAVEIALWILGILRIAEITLFVSSRHIIIGYHSPYAQEQRYAPTKETYTYFMIETEKQEYGKSDGNKRHG